MELEEKIDKLTKLCEEILQKVIEIDNKTLKPKLKEKADYERW